MTAEFERPMIARRMAILTDNEFSGGQKETLGVKWADHLWAKRKTYNTGYSLVVTDPTTNPALPGLSRGERTGSRVFLEIWSYVKDEVGVLSYVVMWVCQDSGSVLWMSHFGSDFKCIDF